jgi:hypothetical protein
MYLAVYYVTNPGIVEARKLMEFFARYHEGRQIGSVNGKEHHSKHGPNVGHESKSVRKKMQNTNSYH